MFEKNGLFLFIFCTFFDFFFALLLPLGVDVLFFDVECEPFLKAKKKTLFETSHSIFQIPVLVVGFKFS